MRSLSISIGFGLLLCTSSCAPPPPRPDVIMVVIDSLRADRLHHAGDPRPLSPHLDQLASQGARFRHASAPAPWTTPSVMSLFTGLYPQTHHVDLNDRALHASVPTLAERLQEAGYFTAAVMPALTLADHYGFDRGFDEFVFSAQGHGNVSGPWSVGESIRLLEEAGDRPVFLYVHLWDVHYNYNPPLPHAVRFQAGRKAGADETDDITVLTAPGRPPQALPPERLAWLEGQYAGEILFTDEQVGRLLDALQRRGRDQDAVVVVTSDHGEAFQEHEVLGHTVHLYDEMTHVPLLVRWPGRIEAGKVLAEQVSLVSLMPTLLEMAGLPYDSTAFDGTSLAGLLLGEEAGASDETALLSTSRQARRRGLRTPKVAYHVDLISGEQELYDLEADPLAQDNLAATQPDRARTWQQRLCRKLATTLPRGEIPVEPLPDDLRDTLAAGLRTLGYVGGSAAAGARAVEPALERQQILAAAGCPSEQRPRTE